MRLPSRVGTLVATIAFLGACSQNNTVQPYDAGPVRTLDGVPFTLPDGAVPVTFCGSNACGPGEECCFATAQCVAVGDRAACPAPTDISTGGCSANSQCAATEFCDVENPAPGSCTGAGRCHDRSNCGSGGFGEVCGCDGRVYSSFVTACNAGVRVVQWARFSTPGACGVPFSTAPNNDSRDAAFDANADAGGTVSTRTACVIDAQCPAPQRCCAITNACFDPAHPEMCQMPPPGTDFPCLSNADCDPRWDMCVGGPGCDAPGFCTPVSSGPCSGLLEPVCGCDGHTYTNACEATAAHVRVASDAGCADQ